MVNYGVTGSGKEQYSGYQAYGSPGDCLELVKLSITLPNGSLITLESDETRLIFDVIRTVMDGGWSGIPVDISAPPQPDDTDVGAEKGTDATPHQEVQNPSGAKNRTNGAAINIGGQPSANGAQSNGGSTASSSVAGDSGEDRLDLARYPQQAREDFTAFCQAINPTGDMRRVVVAAEAANRFFGLDGINADEVGELFDLVGWRRANQFTQTIRNAARTKFGWMERIPGRSGRYAPTDFGRGKTLSG